MARDDNMRLLYINILPTIETEEGKQWFLYAADNFDATHMKAPAEDYAREVERLIAILRKYVPIAGRPYSLSNDGAEDLIQFLLKRHAVHFWRRDVKMPWERGAR